MREIKIEEWEWLGYPAHFICANECNFRMATKVGDVIVSTVGDWRPEGNDKKMERISSDCYFETMVFLARKTTYVSFGWIITGSSLDVEGYQTSEEARRGHMEMCKKQAKERST